MAVFIGSRGQVWFCANPESDPRVWVLMPADTVVETDREYRYASIAENWKVGTLIIGITWDSDANGRT